jgi:ubiquinone/menaquinone biosynthesis C-methylase UbiE
MENEDRNHYDKVVSFFDKEYNWWTDVYREDLPRGFFSFDMRRRLELVIGQLTTEIQKMDNPNVLECGCGPGDILALLAPLHCKLTGVDINHHYLNLAAKKIPRATLIEGNLERLPFPDASFNIVFAVGVYGYLKDDHIAAREIARVTKEGGFVLITVQNYIMLHLLLDPYYIFKFFKKLIGLNKQPSNTEFTNRILRRYTLTQIRNIFKKDDFQEIRSMTTSYGPLRFWCKEIFPLSMSIRISEIIRKLSERKIFTCFKRIGNHLIITLRKGPIPLEK